MAKVTGLNIPPESEDLFLKSVKIRERYDNPRIDRKNVVWRKRNYKELQADSQLNPIAVLWSALSEVNKALWDTAGSHCGLTGYQLFVQDTSYRLENSIEGLATPNNNHQFKVLELDTGEDCNEFYIEQEHDGNYWEYVPTVGTKNARHWEFITEAITLPFLFEFDYYADLELDGELEYWDVSITFYGTKGGNPDMDTLNWSLDLQTGWKRFSENCVPDLDTITDYIVEFWALPVKGIFRLDNLNLYHDSVNYAYDPNCNNLGMKWFDVDGTNYYPWDLYWGGTMPSLGSVYLE